MILAKTCAYFSEGSPNQALESTWDLTWEGSVNQALVGLVGPTNALNSILRAGHHSFSCFWTNNIFFASLLPKNCLAARVV